jgi:allantoate deiminase
VRVHERLDELYAIGGVVGASRVAGTEGEDQAHQLAAGWMREAELDVEVDDAGNLIGRTVEPSVWTGSHLDSVPFGGKFDGALGVVAAIEAVARVGKGAVVVFRDEERGCVGSSAFIERGALPECFLEVHIEQGPVLERAGVPLGLAMGIVGIVRGERTFEGEAGHAGTVPMPGRLDALVAAAEYILRVRETASDIVAELELHADFRLEPVPMAEQPIGAFRAELEERGLPILELPSGAGHDAAILAGAGVPTAMLFVRSLNGGISHSPQEESSPADVELAVDVLAGALARLTAGAD